MSRSVRVDPALFVLPQGFARLPADALGPLLGGAPGLTKKPALVAEGRPVNCAWSLAGRRG